ncbi:MAG: hypothetical protein ABEH78_11360 [Haloferacaceae archaeon]
MRAFQSPPPLAAVRDDLLSSGHLWLRERVAGAPLRFALDDAGLIHFGDDGRTFDPDAVPLGYRFAARHVRESFDRDGFRAAVDAPAAYTFLATATRFVGVPYDFDRLPPVLGLAVVGPDGRAPVDRASAAFDRLGLHALPVLEREVRVRDFDPEAAAWPASAWYDGPVAGVVLDRRGGPWATYVRDGDAPAADPAPFDAADPDALAARLVSPGRAAAAVGLADAGDDLATALAAAGIDSGTAREAAVDAVLREEWGRIGATDGLDAGAVADAVDERVRRLAVGDLA